MDLHIIIKTNENRLIVLIEDVTEKMVIKQKLSHRVNEAKLLSSVLGTYKKYINRVITLRADALLVTNKSGEIKKVNRAAVELFGYGESELINQPISLIIDDHKLVQQAIQKQTVYKKYCLNIEVVCKTKTNEKLLLTFSCSVIKNKRDSLEDIVYIGRDITAKQRRQQRNCTQYAITRILSESQSIKQAIPQILQAICESLGWDLGELWTTNQYIAPTDTSTRVSSSVQQHSNKPVLRCVEIWSSRTVTLREFKAITWQTTYSPGAGLPGRIWVTRSPLWVGDVAPDANPLRSGSATEAGLHTAFGFPILDDSEILGVMIFYSRDVQPKDADLLQMMVSIGSQIALFIKHKQASQLLLESEERYRDLLENVNDMIQSVTPYGRFEYVNRAWLQTLGYTKAEIAQMNLFDIIHPNFKAECRQLFYRVMSGEKIEQVTTAFLTKSGEKIYVEGKINCKFVGGKPVATRGIFRNITQQVVTEKALRSQQEQTKSLLLNNLSEAIFNPLKQQSGNEGSG